MARHRASIGDRFCCVFVAYAYSNQRRRRRRRRCSLCQVGIGARTLPNERGTSIQCRSDAEPPSVTLAQHLAGIVCRCGYILGAAGPG